MNTLKQGSWLLTVPLAIVGLAYLYFLFLPGKAEINRLRADLIEKQRSVSEAGFIKLRIHETQQEIVRTQEYTDTWRSEQTHGLSRVLAQIGDEVQLSGARTSSFDPQPTIQHEVLKQTELALGVDGHFSEIFDMLRRLETLDANIRIQQISIEAGASTQDLLASKVTLAIFSVNRDNSN